MKRLLIIIFAIFAFLTTYSQSPVDFSKFKVRQSDTVTLLTADLLTKIDWQAIKSFCTGTNGHYAYERNDSLITTYEYAKQGLVSSFKITSYKGMVMEYYSEADYLTPKSSIYFFDKNVWMKYVNEMMPSLPDQFKITHDEPDNILKAYYRLLGINTRDEYGFICEYSAHGRATDRRIAVITLLKQHRIDLLRKLSEYPNLQTKLYAVDALIYNNYTTKEKIQQWEKEINDKQKQLNRLQKKNSVKMKIHDLQNQIKIVSDSISYFNSVLLTDTEWKTIYNLRDSNQTIKTCKDGTGSYKIYGTVISDLLSDKAIADIPKWYEGLKKMGYFQ